MLDNILLFPELIPNAACVRLHAYIKRMYTHMYVDMYTLPVSNCLLRP